MSLDAVVKAVFLLVGMGAAGVVHVLWMRTSLARRCAWPVDAGLTLRRRRLFGDNKRVSGFMVMPLAAAATFLLLGTWSELLPQAVKEGLWPLSGRQYAVIGFCCGAAFMLAELPNSLLKRQLDIAPGEVPEKTGLRLMVLILDRLDSVLGVLLVLSLLVPVPAATWLLLLVLGPLLHAGLSSCMYLMGLKKRVL